MRRVSILVVVLAALLLVALPGMGDAQEGIRYYPAASGDASVSITNLTIVDDFAGQTTTSTNLGQLGWSFIAGTVAAVTSAVDNHPGVVKVNVVAGPSVSYIYLPQTGSNPPFQLNDIYSMIWVGAFETGANIPTKRLGTTSTAVNAAPADDSIYFECLTDDTNWFAVTRDGAASQTRTDTGVAFSANAYVTFEIRHPSASTWEFYMDGVLKASHTSAQTPPVETTSIYPIFGMETTGTAAGYFVDLFAVNLRPTR